MVYQKLFHVRNLCQFGIVPQLFEFVVVAVFGQENMYQNAAVVDNYPLAVLVSVVSERFGAGMLLHIFSYAVGYRCYLSGRLSFADDKVRSSSRFYVREVYGCDFLSFFFLNAFYNSFN